MSNILLTIIIPHYNTPELLDKLLSTIPVDEHIQIIVIDDNSTKDIENYKMVESKYSESVLFLRNRSGVQSAGTCRNVGIDHATGKWLLFADADDFFLDEAFDDEVLRIMRESTSDIIFFPPISRYLGSDIDAGRQKDFTSCIDMYKNAPRIGNLWLRYRWVGPVSKLIRRSLVTDNCIRFDETLVANDVMFSTLVGYYADTIEVAEKNIYCITKTSESLTTRKSEENILLRTDITVKRISFLREKISKKEFESLKLSGKATMFEIVMNGYRFGTFIVALKKMITGRVPLVSFFDLGRDICSVSARLRQKLIEKKMMNYD